MTKSNRFLLAGAAIAGLLAGTAATIQASNLTNASAQDDSAKADKKVIEARNDARNDKIDAEYKVAKEKCDALAGAGKDSCISDAKAKFGK